MDELLSDSLEELKRADHQVYVTLKYTRTGDVMVNTVRRLVDAYDLMFEVLLLKHFEANDLDEDMIPTAPIRRVMMIEDIFKSEPEVLKNAKLYRLFKLL